MKILAKIRWYDNVAGEGLVRLPSGESVYLNKMVLPDVNIYLERDMPCIVTVYRDSHFSSIQTLELPS